MVGARGRAIALGMANPFDLAINSQNLGCTLTKVCAWELLILFCCPQLLHGNRMPRTRRRNLPARSRENWISYVAVRPLPLLIVIAPALGGLRVVPMLVMVARN